MNYENYPPALAEEIVRLRRRIDAAGVPAKVADRNLLIASWNIRSFGPVHPSFDENPGSPKRNLRGLAHIAEIIRLFDVVAIQEVRRDLRGIRTLLDWLGPDWGLVVSDVTRGDEGNSERLSFVYDRRRVQPSGLAAELVLPPMAGGDPSRQFARTPYAVSFRAAEEEFVLVTLHVLYGDVPEDREGELRAIAEWLAEWGSDEDRYHRDLMVLGDFNIDRRGDPRFEVFTSTGLNVPAAIRDARTTIYDRAAKHYDQIGWFMGQIEIQHTGRAGTIEFGNAVFRELSLFQKSWRVSDHLPLWAEFSIDRTGEALGRTLEVDLDAPDPFADVPD
ncbi:MAG: endonuclease/exonuclease/phosphatase family protein [Gemmatimonadetes bacterium]|uniref:Endonuclease/exonuclease/phosphatase family protein n=1 Tax=Candidatus Kutchimonas denitrificans TaxID=3056748 RepID=A0AAE4Z8N3_9BACT|nr:endonuclease/exonuclease/phosphatase family protein [Gemmatimonadota bacterium]NIR75864.1 endonuclease/exonuclease/phosphatase family protein [Candidatus Kutchimonas denitrificans]NIS02031.1 endonuclease/exonuclease/phosphatase family protein [Gemmatimonadota bacterium]NIT67835.1 endonuclease/exonuclease/phosphatase family protein [Gemmatimonadota bacterium]NIU53821.1 endonuclease [Gemmatimonadota bacterium]